MKSSTYLESQILTSINELDRIYSDLWEISETQSLPGHENYRAEDESDLETQFERLAAQTVIKCKVYLETQGLHYLLRDFTSDANSFLKSNRALLSGEFDSEIFVKYSKFTQFVWNYMSSFKFMRHGIIEELGKSAGVSILENILRATAFILERDNIVPDRETAISNAVRTYVEVAFPSAQFPSHSFMKTAKEYIPDILVPMLKTAVEYKYATTEKSLSNTVDQILIDVEGYDGHSSYVLFYAVFYVKTGACTQERFQEIWEEKNFPANWKPIFINGK